MGKSGTVWLVCGLLAVIVAGSIMLGTLFVVAGIASTVTGGSAEPADTGLGTGGGDLADGQAMSACQVDKFLKKEAAGGMNNSGPGLVAAATKYKVNPAFMLGIANAENSLGRAGLAVPNKNPGNVKLDAGTAREQDIQVAGNDSQGHTIFANWQSGWSGLAYTLRRFYLDEGRTTLEKISEIYLTGDKAAWINNINSVMQPALKTKC
jgi:hypothetical protein